MKRQLIWLSLWGVTFGYIEAAIVIYLRKIYYPAGFTFPIVLAEQNIALVEIIRELATLVILWASAELAYKTFQKKFAVFMILFGIWDIFYYVFLKIFLDWPESFFAWDILFLIPAPWVGPVWAPVLVSLGLIYVGFNTLRLCEQGRVLRLKKSFWIFESLMGMIIITSFLIPGRAVLTGESPAHYPWYLFLVGFCLGLGAYLYQVRLVSDSVRVSS